MVRKRSAQKKNPAKKDWPEIGGAEKVHAEMVAQKSRGPN